jgi:hypothetical protein
MPLDFSPADVLRIFASSFTCSLSDTSLFELVASGELFVLKEVVARFLTEREN